MPPSKKTSIFERKLQELSAQSELIERDIRSVQKVLKKPGAAELPELKSTAIETRRPEPARPAPAPEPRPEPAPTAVRPPPQAEPAKPPEDDLFKGVALPPPPSRSVMGADGVIRKAPPPKERFANYFSSGSFGKSRPMAQEKKIQRNKAVFMVIFVAFIAFLLFKAMS